MLGDGANDTLAFAAAFARGTPVVHRGLLESRADFYYLGRGLAGLRRLFEVNATLRRTHLCRAAGVFRGLQCRSRSASRSPGHG